MSSHEYFVTLYHTVMSGRAHWKIDIGPKIVQLLSKEGKWRQTIVLQPGYEHLMEKHANNNVIIAMEKHPLHVM